MDDNCFQSIILKLQYFWAKAGCAILQPYDMEMGAGTFHPATAFCALGPKPWNVAFVQPCRRPTDGRYGDNPMRLQRYYQFQVILKPSPDDVREQLISSLREIGLKPEVHDIRFVEDDWESPTLGASGLGWEVWCDGMEVVQFTYFQQFGGIQCHPVAAEITYGLERIAMCVQAVDSFFAIDWNGKPAEQNISYHDVHMQSEKEFSAYNFELANVPHLLQRFEYAVSECQTLLDNALPLPAYDECIRASHIFNLLDARGAISVAQRAVYIKNIRSLARRCFEVWLHKIQQT